jgi:hypothetical protein
MSTARDLLTDLAGIGARIEPAGERIILRAGPTAIPAALVRRVREAKADLLATLAVSTAPTVVRGNEDGEDGRNSSLHQAKDQAFGSLIVEWLNQHPAPSVPGLCACCGRPDSPSAVIVPFGTEPGTHTWLHAECWPAWHEARRADAIATLRATRPSIKRP